MSASSANHQKKILAIQQLRGVAVLLVVLVHTINIIDIRVDKGVDEDRGRISTFLALNEFGAAGVDLFFVISGFVMALILARAARPSHADFLRDRFIRIVPLFWIASAVFTMLSWAIGRHIPTAFIVTTITVLPLNPLRYDWPVLVVGWSLGFELAFYLLVASVLSASRPSARLAGMLAFFAAATVLYPARPGTLAILTNPIQLEFLWGILAYVAYQKTKAERWSAWLGAASVFLGGSAILHSCVSGFPFSADYRAIIDGSSSLKRAIFWGLPWAAIVLGYLLLSNGKETQSLLVGHRFLHFVGEASYSLYLTHLMFCLAAEVLLPPSLIHPDVVIAGTFVLACSGGILFYVLIELPLLRSLAPRKESNHLSLTPPFPPVRSGRAR